MWPHGFLGDSIPPIRMSTTCTVRSAVSAVPRVSSKSRISPLVGPVLLWTLFHFRMPMATSRKPRLPRMGGATFCPQMSAPSLSGLGSSPGPRSEA